MTNLATALILVMAQSAPSIGQDRLKVVTEDIVAVVDDEMNNGGLKSKIARADAISMLAAAVTAESGVREDVETCKVSGDGGKSVGLGQVMRGANWEGHSKKEICNDRKLQLKLALHVIDRCWVRTPRGDAAFRCYTSGDASKNSYVAMREYNLYRKYHKSVDNLQRASNGDGLVAKINDKHIVVARNP
jgi:hypothetical protein